MPLRVVTVELITGIYVIELGKKSLVKRNIRGGDDIEVIVWGKFEFVYFGCLPIVVVPHPICCLCASA